MYISLKSSEQIIGIDYSYSDESIKRPTFFFNSRNSIISGQEIWDVISMFNGLFSVEDISYMLYSRYNYSQDMIHRIMHEFNNWDIVKTSAAPAIWDESINSNANMQLFESYSIYLADQNTLSFDLCVLLSKYNFISFVYPQDYIVTSDMVFESVFLNQDDVGKTISGILADKFNIFNICFAKETEDHSKNIIISNNSCYFDSENALVVAPNDYEEKEICHHSLFSITSPSNDVALFCKAFNIHNDILLSVLNGVYN